MILPLADPLALAADRPEPGLVDALTAIEEGTQRWPTEAGGHFAALLSHPSRRVRRRAAGALTAAVACGDVDLAFAQALLDDATAATRWGAAFALHRAGLASVRAVDVALETLGDDDGDLRWAASGVIACGAGLVPDLAARLRNLASSGSATTRKMALLCLAHAGDCDASFACRALGDADTYVRLAAVTVLGRLNENGTSVREALATVAAADTEAAVRRAAGAVLRRLDHPRKKENP